MNLFSTSHGSVDHSRLFIAEELTPLFYTPDYARLPEAVRRRYNQLHALYFNEQVTFFEQELLSPAWQTLLRRHVLPADLGQVLQTFFEEEQRHTAAFRALNLASAPQLYGKKPYHFVRVTRPARALLRALAGRPFAAPVLVWLALLQEERSLYYSKRCLEQAADIEPHFAAVHRAHLADEVGHVGWDELLLDWLWPRMSSSARTTTAWMLGRLIGEFFYLPKRSGARVVWQLAREFPQLDALALACGMQRLAGNPDFLDTLYSRRIAPRTFARFDAHPEFALLSRTLASYPAHGSPGMKSLIPKRLNLTIAATQLAVMLTLLWAAGQVVAWWAVALLALGYGVVMNSGYAMLHEAEHGMLHPNRRINDGVGTALALFFPAPFHLIRQGHLGHHIRNRSDDEAFDLYFSNESRFWKCVQLYGTLTGIFWVLIYITNFVVLLRPSLALPGRINRTHEAFMESLNPRYARMIQAEAFAVVMLHAGLVWGWHIPLTHYFAVMFGFGFMWSAMQYAHHYGTERDVLKGARNLKTFRLLDLVWLNHNWHRNHHAQPTTPWIYLPRQGNYYEERGSLLGAYVVMWQGPQPANEHVENRYAGKLVQ